MGPMYHSGGINVSKHTVRNYLLRIFDKLGISSRVELVLYAFSGTEEIPASESSRAYSAPSRRKFVLPRGKLRRDFLGSTRGIINLDRVGQYTLELHGCVQLLCQFRYQRHKSIDLLNGGQGERALVIDLSPRRISRKRYRSIPRMSSPTFGSEAFTNRKGKPIRRSRSMPRPSICNPNPHP